MADLKPEEQSRINDLLSQRKLCMVNEITRLDDGQTSVEYLVQLVSWKCAKYEEDIKNALYSDFHVTLSDSWSYSNDLHEAAPQEITEAVVLRRQDKAKSQDDQELLRISD